MKIIISLFCIFSGIGNLLYAQGCSDAGICSIPGFRPGQHNASREVKGSLNFGMALGMGDQTIMSVSPYFSGTQNWSKTFGYDVRINAVFNTGNGISVLGGGDGFLNLNFRPATAFGFSAGIKVPFSKADRAEDGKPLPMDYQTSLGSMDLITGMTYRTASWLIVLAYQQPLSQNQNKYDPQLWAGDSIMSSFQETNNFQRSGDIMARLAYQFRVGEKINLTAGVVPIYHIEEDTYFEEGSGFLPIQGSDGLTINASLYFEIKMREKNSLGINLGFPLLVRDVRPDGLTRSFVLGVEYQIPTFRN